ncbi:MAG TPA: hypothetical protein VHM02_02205, partial [Thermoanaerobaculia bacterium]|nr:hypothetical protein [Thermoanaerobaculia bacterium]
MTVPGPSYPGNPSLSPDVRRRVEATYRQSLDLARQGNRQEASLGCDFVLQLLRRREAEELFGGFDEGGEALSALPDLPDLLDLPELSAPEAPAAAADDLAGRLAALVAARRDAEAVDLAGRHADRVAADPRLAELAQTAAGRLEAAPYVERFLATAREARLAGDHA